MSKSKKTETKESTLYYFYSQGCGWCKRTEPIIDELNKEGYDILKLDTADTTNGQINRDLQGKYQVQCGTPFMIDAESGRNICGFREKDIIEKWANGEEIPAPPRPTGPPPRPPFQGAPKAEDKKWTKEYNAWLAENKHLPDNQKKTAKEILDMPRPKSEPPKPPMPNSTPEQLAEWKKGYETWYNENTHLPNLQNVDQVMARLQQQQAMMAQNQATTNFSKNLNTDFHYVVENGQKVEVHAEPQYIQSLKQQYYVREADGKLSKVVGDTQFEMRQQQRLSNKPPLPQANNSAPNVQGPQAGPPTSEVKEISEAELKSGLESQGVSKEAVEKGLENLKEKTS